MMEPGLDAFMKAVEKGFSECDCLRCLCMVETLKAVSRSQEAGKAGKEFTAWLDSALARASNQHDCIGCDPCLGAVAFNSFDRRREDGRRIVPLDPKGYFIIVVDRSIGQITVTNFDYDDELIGTFAGNDAVEIYHWLIDEERISLLSHSAYMGKELALAQRALESGSEYIQGGCGTASCDCE